MIIYKDIILRDFILSDIEKRIDWETNETEWKLWDAPWEYEGLTPEEEEQAFKDYVDKLNGLAEKFKNMPESEQRSSFQIVTREDQEKYVGYVNSYEIDESYNYTAGQGYCTVGINIPDLSARGKGYSYQALCAFIKYLLEHGKESIYLQTWSGNERMVHVAEKTGFEECNRNIGTRFVRGKTYDGLTFKLNMEKFEAFSGK